MGKKIRIRIRDEQPGSYFRTLRNNSLGKIKILIFFDADPGWKNFGSGINIADPQHWFIEKIERKDRNINGDLRGKKKTVPVATL